MSSSTKKSGGTMGVSQKSERNSENSGCSGGVGGNGGSVVGGGVGGGGAGAKGDSISTTPSKSSKHGVTKNKSSTGNVNTPNSKASNNSVCGGGVGLNDGTGANPTILNQQALEALYSATYVEDFIDCNDNMGDDLIRQTTRMFEMGSNYMTYIRDLESAMAILLGDSDSDNIILDQLSADKKKAVFRLQNVLMTAQDTGDDSLQVMQSIQDHIENKTRQLDVDRKNLAEFCKEQDTPETPFKDPPPPPTERNIKRARRNRHEIYRPSILGPSSLKATSYPENNVSNNTRDHHDTHVVVTSSRSRNKEERNAAREAAREAAAAAAAAAAGSSGVDSHPSQPSNQTSGSTTSSVAVAGQVASTVSSSSSSVASTVATDGPNAVANEEPPPPAQTQKTNGRTSERSGGQTTTRSSTTAAANAEHNSSNSEKRTSGVGYSSSSSSKKQSQKSQAQEKKTKKRKAKQSSSSNSRKEDNSPQTYGIDPDEPTYCLCDQVSYGEMIGCDNDLCPIEWFHFSCVNLNTKPKGKWFCPNCRGEKPNVMKPKNVFLKELEKYNREKEEKA